MKVNVDYSPEDRETFKRMLQEAAKAYTDPSQSGYHVRAVGITKDRNIVTGGNKENSLSDAYIHGETAVISRIRDQYGNVPITAIGFYSEKKENTSICPCGACRDILIQQTSPDLVLFAGNQEDIKLARLKDFTFEDFHPIEISKTDRSGLTDAKIALNKSTTCYFRLSSDLFKKVYGVSIVTEDYETYQGSLYTNAGYDAITPGLAAIQTWRNSKLLYKTDVVKIVFVAQGCIPSPYYRDRQALLELVDITSLDSGRKTPVLVELINIDNLGNIVEMAVTDTDEWLPHPFSARQFGKDYAIEIQYHQLFKTIR